MDSYDIFKKLSKGTKFSRSHNRIFHSKPQESKQIDQFKEGVLKDSFNAQLCSYSADSVIEQSTADNKITILSSLDISSTKKTRKRKHEENNEADSERKKKLIETERINHYRNIEGISVVGKNVPEPAYTFNHFEIDADILKNLKKCGYEEPTPIQKQGVPIMLKGQQVLACAPTGSGKTAAFLVPIIQQLKGPLKQGFRSVILCPTRELAKQTQRECVRLSEGRKFRIHIISKIKKALEQYGPKSNQKFDILVTTPKRLCFLLNQEPPAICLREVEWVVVDEADKLFEEGSHGFRQQLDQIMLACKNENRKVAMFSATCTPVVSKWCVRNMKPLIRVTIGHRNAATLTVDQKLFFVGNEHGKLLAFRDMVRKGIAPPVLVFVQSKERAQQLFNELIYDGINVDAIHADRTQLQRDNTVKAFREGKIWVLICTELMARGVDFKGVNLVLNYDFPPSSISYVHRIGRAGRAGRKGSAVTFFTTEDVVNLRSLAHILRESGCEVPPYMLTIKKKNKKEKKKLEKAAPKRDDICTFPVYYTMRKRRRNNKILPSKEGEVEGNSSSSSKQTNTAKKLVTHFQKLKQTSDIRKRKVESKEMKKVGMKNKYTKTEHKVNINSARKKAKYDVGRKM